MVCCNRNRCLVLTFFIWVGVQDNLSIGQTVRMQENGIVQDRQAERYD